MTYCWTNRPQILFKKTQVVADFHTQFVPAKVYKRWNIQELSNRRICYNGGYAPIALKIHKNPYLWATNKTVVATIMVHASINSATGNC